MDMGSQDTSSGNAVGCCGLLAASPFSLGLLRLLVLTFVLVTTLFFVRSYISFNMQTVRLPRWMGECGASCWGLGT